MTDDDELSRLQRDWDGLARHDAMWAILSDPAKRGGGWQADDFFATGRDEIAQVFGGVSRLQRRRGGPVPYRRALDFGCGLGRLSQALAAYFDAVDGVDISASMVEQARSHDRSAGKVSYHVNAAPTLPFADASFDFVYSNIVLQHIGGERALGYIGEFARVLMPGGVVVFSMPAQRIGGDDGDDATAVETGEGTCMIRMHTIARAEVEQRLLAGGATPIDIHDHPVAGPHYECLRYVAVRD